MQMMCRGHAYLLKQGKYSNLVPADFGRETTTALEKKRQASISNVLFYWLSGRYFKVWQSSCYFNTAVRHPRIVTNHCDVTAACLEAGQVYLAKLLMEYQISTAWFGLAKSKSGQPQKECNGIRLELERSRGPLLTDFKPGIAL